MRDQARIGGVDIQAVSTGNSVMFAAKKKKAGGIIVLERNMGRRGYTYTYI